MIITDDNNNDNSKYTVLYYYKGTVLWWNKSFSVFYCPFIIIACKANNCTAISWLSSSPPYFYLVTSSDKPTRCVFGMEWGKGIEWVMH